MAATNDTADAPRPVSQSQYGYGPLVSPRNIGRSRSNTVFASNSTVAASGVVDAGNKGGLSRSPRRFTNTLFRRGAESDRATSKVSAAYPSDSRGDVDQENQKDTNAKDHDSREVSGSSRSSPKNEVVLSNKDPPLGSDEYV